MTLLLTITLAYACGLLAGLREPQSIVTLIILSFVCVLIALRTRRRRAVAIMFILAGVIAGSIRTTGAARDCRELLPDGARVRLTGVPLVVPTEGVTLPVHVTSLSGGGVSCEGVVVRVRAPARHHATLDSAVSEHAAIDVSGRWAAYAPRSGWPRKPEFAGGVFVDAIELLDEAEGANAATRFRTHQQRRLRALLPERWGLAESLLLAENAGITPEVRRRWVSSGLIHLLAISGMHVGLIAGGVMLLCMAFRVPPRTARRIAILVSTAYVLFLGAPSAALRSLLQACLLLASVELQRPAERFTALAAAALVILLIEPLAILDVGFQLSFAGMVGLVGWYKPVGEMLPSRLHPYVRDGLAAGIAATALTTPVAALHFGTASWIGIPATLIAAPLFAAALALLVIALAVAAITGAVTGPHAWLTDAALHVLDRIAGFAAAVPGGHGYMARNTVLYLLLAAAAALLVRASLRRPAEAAPPSHASDAAHRRHARRGRRRGFQAAAAAAAAIAIVAWAPVLFRPGDGMVEIHAIDVGQGDAFAIRTPAGHWLLVDTGPRTMRSDAGRDRVVPYLLAHGVRRLEALILTHPDADHIGGAEAVLEAFDVGLVIDPGLAAGKDLFIDLLVAARGADQRWIAGRAGQSFDIDGVQISVLYPLAGAPVSSNANDRSIVFRMAFGTFAALFLGDAPTSVEEELVALHGDGLGAAVLKVGHHGSATSTGELLLQTIRPTHALVSSGRYNRYGHPNPGVIGRLERHEVRVLRTDQSGNFIVRAARSGRIDVLAR